MALLFASWLPIVCAMRKVSINAFVSNPIKPAPR
jgi:hypothetical protein